MSTTHERSMMPTIDDEGAGAAPARRPLAYLASPYSAPTDAEREARFHDVCVAAAILMNAGHHVLSPIAHSHPIAVHGLLPTEFAWWAEYDHALLDRCDELWVLTLPGWRESRGVTDEIAYARARGIPVKLVDDETLEVMPW